MLAEHNAGDTIEVSGIGPRQVALLLIGALVIFCDGFDAQIIGVTGPALSADWHLARQALAPVFAANLAGLMIGAITITPIADLWSRKTIILGCVAAFGGLSLLTLATSTLLELGVVRFLTGLALGAAMPSVIAAASEFVPIERRTRIVVALSCSFSAGFAVCGIAASVLLGGYGWRAVFWLGGLLPLLSLPLVAAYFPESPTYLVKSGQMAALHALLARMGPGLRYRPTRQPHLGRQGFPVGDLFRDGRATVTACIWLTYFCSGATLYFLSNWLPIMMTTAGFGMDASALSSTCYQIGGLTGGFLIAYLMDRFGIAALAAWLFAASLGVALIGPASFSLATILAAALLAGVMVVGGQGALHAYVGGRLYPSNLRATGLGWALGMVRLGGVLAGSLGAGLVIGLDLGARNTFMIIAAPEIVCGLAVLVIHLRGAGTAALTAAE